MKPKHPAVETQRFAVLYHDLSQRVSEHNPVPAVSCRASHFDLLIQMGETLATWELASWPPQQQQRVHRLDDHRLAYLSFEGELSDDRGVVTRVDEGKYQALEKSSQSFLVQLWGSRFRGVVRIAMDSTGDWSLTVQDAATSNP